MLSLENLQPRAAMITKILVCDYWRPAGRAGANFAVLPDMQITGVNHGAGILLKRFALLF